MLHQINTIKHFYRNQHVTWNGDSAQVYPVFCSGQIFVNYICSLCSIHVGRPFADAVQSSVGIFRKLVPKAFSIGSHAKHGRNVTGFISAGYCSSKHRASLYERLFFGTEPAITSP
jgi:hypothetical protein